jgi:hypothetical protein
MEEGSDVRGSSYVLFVPPKEVTGPEMAKHANSGLSLEQALS